MNLENDSGRLEVCAVLYCTVCDSTQSRVSESLVQQSVGQSVVKLRQLAGLLRMFRVTAVGTYFFIYCIFSYYSRFISFYRVVLYCILNCCLIKKDIY